MTARIHALPKGAELPRCPVCDGSGEQYPNECPTCGGTGTLIPGCCEEALVLCTGPNCLAKTGHVDPNCLKCSTTDSPGFEPCDACREEPRPQHEHNFGPG